MADFKNALPIQQRTGNPLIRMFLLPQCMGWLLDDGSIFIYGFNGIHSVYGHVGYPQAIEFFTFNFQLLERQAI